MNCNNCGAIVNEKFCANCGQKKSTGRLTVHELVHDGWHAVTHTDKGLLKLIKDLLFHPLSFYKNYFNGQRKTYFSPVLFFLLTAGAFALLYAYVFVYQDKVFHTNNEFGKMAYHETKFRALILLPIQIILTWAAFRKYYNLAEVAVFWMFALGLTYVLRIASIPLYFPLIGYKDVLDYVFYYLCFVIIIWQGMALFGRNVISILTFFVIFNISIVLDFVVVMYILFGYDIFNNPLQIKTWWDLIKAAY
ncbi:MAG: DUF3667 domain-containing protein [Bacteroidota bacterium]